MAKNNYFENLEIMEILGTIREYEDNDWAKVVLRGKWFDKEPTIQIRPMNLTTKVIGKGGAGYTNEEIDELVKVLVENDFGDLEDLKAAVTKREKRFTVEAPEPLDEETSKEIIELKDIVKYEE